ncbi:MAG: hypothetical protein WA160_05805 [Pseudobdellovibrio sp.]
MKNLPLIAAIIFLAQIALATNKEKGMTKAWFAETACTSLEILKYKSISEKKITDAIQISENEAIQKIIKRIQKIPSGGEMMAKMGPHAEKIVLQFKCKNEMQEIEIIEKKFKTPSTGFNAERTDIEKDLYADIHALLVPELNENVLKIENLDIKFKNMSVIYKGAEVNKKTSASDFTFIVKDKNGSEQIIKISTEQAAPQPVEFEVNNLKYALLTYENKNTKRIFPDYFQIIKK